MVQQRALAVPVPIEPVIARVAADAVIDRGRKHPVFTGVARGIHHVARCFEEAVDAEKLVHERTEGRAVAVAREALRVLLEGLRRDDD